MVTAPASHLPIDALLMWPISAPSTFVIVALWKLPSRVTSQEKAVRPPPPSLNVLKTVRHKFA